MSGKLLIARHGESEWNALGKWTGITDVHLSEKGFHEAALLGEAIKDIKIDYAFCSQQVRTLETLEQMLDAAKQYDVPFERSAAINERDYGDYTGLNKWDMQKKLGDAEFQLVRRGWDHPIPNGESLKMVYERTIPYYKSFMLPRLLKGENVLMVAHGNSIRSLVKYIESINDEDIGKVEMIFGEILIYTVDKAGKQLTKEDRHIKTTPPPV